MSIQLSTFKTFPRGKQAFSFDTQKEFWKYIAAETLQVLKYI